VEDLCFRLIELTSNHSNGCVKLRLYCVNSIHRMTQSNPQLLHPVVPTLGDSTTRSRAESRDYGMQPSATIALLPAIAEEKHGNGGGGTGHPGYHKSVSMIETSRHPSLPPPQLVPPDLLNEKGTEVCCHYRLYKVCLC